MKNSVVILGVGFKPNLKFKESENVFLSEHVKVNFGTACARTLAEAGYDLVIISKTQQKIDKIKEDLQSLYPERAIRSVAMDVLDINQVKRFFISLDRDASYSYIHSAGLGAGGYKIKNDNPYLQIENISDDQPTMEFNVVVKSLLLFVKGFLPFFRRQKEAKVIVINSMSGIRPYPLGFSHSSAKAGLHNAVRSLTLELNKENIFFTEINPGMADTGFYDNDAVKNSVLKISREFGYEYDNLPQMSPYDVANTVLLCLENNAHILNIDMVARGQFPHIGA